MNTYLKSVCNVLVTIFLYCFLSSKIVQAQSNLIKSIVLPENISNINHIALDKDNSVWIATNRGAINYSTEIKIIFDINDPTKFKINQIYIDRFDTKWFGTYRASVIRYVDENDFEELKFSHLTNNKNRLITSINKYDSLLFCTTDNGEIIKLNLLSKQSEKISSPTLLPIYNFVWDQDINTYWTCSASGLYYSQSINQNNVWNSVENFLVVYGIKRVDGLNWAFGKSIKNTPALMLLYDNGKILNKRFKTWKTFNINNLNVENAKFNDIAFLSDEQLLIALGKRIFSYNPFSGECTEIIFNNEALTSDIQHILVRNNTTIFFATTKNLYQLRILKK